MTNDTRDTSVHWKDEINLELETDMFPYKQLDPILIDSSLFPEYDTLVLYYDVTIRIPKWSDEHHDSLRLEVIHNDGRDTVLWNAVEIFGHSRKKSKWRMICNIGFYMDSVDWAYYPLMKYLHDSIITMVSERLYYVDDFYWSLNRDIYLKEHRSHLVRGTIKLR